MRNRSCVCQALWVCLLIVVFGGCDATQPGDDITDDITQPGDEATMDFLNPDAVVARFDVCCRIHHVNELAKRRGPSKVAMQDDGSLLLADNRTIWKYSASGDLIWEESIREDRNCEPVSGADLEYFACEEVEGVSEVLRVNDAGKVVESFVIAAGDEESRLLSASDGILRVQPFDSMTTLVSYGSGGQMLWSRTVDGRGYDEGTLPDGGVVVVGGVRTPFDDLAPNPATVHRIDAQGNVVWSQRIEDCPFGCTLWSVWALPGERFLAHGGITIETSPRHFSGQLFLALLDGDGAVLWDSRETLADPDRLDIGRVHAVQSERNVVAVAYSRSSLGAYRVQTAYFNEEGALAGIYDWPASLQLPPRFGARCAIKDTSTGMDLSMTILLECNDLQGLSFYTGDTWYEVVMI